MVAHMRIAIACMRSYFALAPCLIIYGADTRALPLPRIRIARSGNEAVNENRGIEERKSQDCLYAKSRTYYTRMTTKRADFRAILS